MRASGVSDQALLIACALAAVAFPPRVRCSRHWAPYLSARSQLRIIRGPWGDRLVAQRKVARRWWGDGPHGVPTCQPAPRSHWLCLSPRTLCCAALGLFLSWTSLAADSAAAVVSRGWGWGWGMVRPGPSVWRRVEVSCPESPGQGCLPVSVPNLDSQNREGLDQPHQSPCPSYGDRGPEKGRGLPKITRYLGTRPR